MAIAFDDSLITGNDMIDTQHRELIERIASFVACCERGDSKVQAIKMLDYMDEYTNFHFSAEEKLQEEAQYPGISEHRQKHEEFKKNIAELYDYLDELEGPTDEFTEIVRKKVEDWLMYHIKTFDRSVAEYINMRDNADRL